MLQSNAAMDKAVSVFSLASDKEIANMAAYRAMGMHPADAPRFGWGLSDRPRVEMTTQSITPGISPLAAATIGGLVIALGTMLYNNYSKPAVAAVPTINNVPIKTNSPINIGGLQAEICEELDSDPVFAEEIKRDLLIIGAKIKAHKDKRLQNVAPPASAP